MTTALPTSVKEMHARGWDEADAILFTGDAYIDHPAFGSAVIGRLLEGMGLRVAIVPQPNWRDDLRDFRKLGRPRLFFGVTAGAMDSMINHYTANKRLRSDDAYTPGGKAGARPDYPTVVYSQILKKLFPDTPVILGGIEASLRRVVHYDYWQHRLLPPILEQTGADLLIYGMGEEPLRQVVERLRAGEPFAGLTNVPQTAYLHKGNEVPAMAQSYIRLASLAECVRDKKNYARNFVHVETESNRMEGNGLVQKVPGGWLVLHGACPPMTTVQIDQSFDRPYTRQPHPRYAGKPAIPAYDMIMHSVNIHRGCFGGCSFCTISAHQGKFVSSRSEQSVLRELKEITALPGFKGHITDLGGPSANMYAMQGTDEDTCRVCKRPSCVYPRICPNLDTDHSALNSLYAKAATVEGIKKITIGSGLRYDLFMPQSNPRAGKPEQEYARNLVKNHVSGRLKVAPEHTDPATLQIMRKPSFELFTEFHRYFERINRAEGLKQQLVPYFISAHPGTTREAMDSLGQRMHSMGYQLEQVQMFTPSPMTLATVMYFTGLDPYTLQPVAVARDTDSRTSQHRKFFGQGRGGRAK